MKPIQLAQSRLTNRRDFIEIMGKGALAACLLPGLSPLSSSGNELYNLSEGLLREWSAALLRLQVTDSKSPATYGGIKSPDNGIIPGRCADAIYPFLCVAQLTKDGRYIRSAELLYQWMEANVSASDGAWLNEPKTNSWKGITVFTTIGLCEALRYHGELMEPAFRSRIRERLVKSATYIHDHFAVDYGNINYPISGTYALTIAGDILDNPAFKAKGKALADQVKSYFSASDHLIYGEGAMPYDKKSPKGCLPIDLGYNVEESLPSLVQYALHVNDKELLVQLKQSLRAHMQFMLPDGAWDNSWGTRMFKWTYWGSRTSDGCQTAYALLADSDPQFYTAALRNTQLLKSCTANGLLQGGPHEAAHTLQSSVHHSFCHAKAMANVCNNKQKLPATLRPVALPREIDQGVKYFPDIRTWLIAIGNWRATFTGYDVDYKDFLNGHPTGALSMLWHKKAGPIIAASMNQYQLYEKDNMRAESQPPTIGLCPRIEIATGTGYYTNISDRSTDIKVTDNGNSILVETTGRVVDGHQNPAPGLSSCMTTWRFSKDMLLFGMKAIGEDANSVSILVPLVSSNNEAFSLEKKSIKIRKEAATLTVASDKPFNLLPGSINNRIYNPVPGFEALGLVTKGQSANFNISVGS